MKLYIIHLKYEDVNLFEEVVMHSWTRALFILLAPLTLCCVFGPIWAALFVGQGTTENKDWRTTGKTSQELFEGLIEKPIPSDIKNLQGSGFIWQGYSVWLRFVANEKFPEKLLKEGYTENPWKDNQTHFNELPKELSKRFTPPWAPEKIEKKRCFMKHLKNGWTHDGTHYFIFDQETHEVYFFGGGT
jgi:hypothetical protein